MRGNRRGAHTQGDDTLPHWYAMRTPTDTLSEDYARLGLTVAAATGGTLFPHPHVTVAYLAGEAAPDDVARALRRLTGPLVPVHAHGLFSFWETPHPTFGYTLALHVTADATLYAWHEAIVAALLPLGLILSFPWDEERLHLRVVQQMAMPPAEAITRLAGVTPTLTLLTSYLWVTRLAHGYFRTYLHRPLAGGATGS